MTSAEEKKRNDAIRLCFPRDEEDGLAYRSAEARGNLLSLSITFHLGSCASWPTRLNPQGSFSPRLPV
jgi:hypothetical protein